MFSGTLFRELITGLTQPQFLHTLVVDTIRVFVILVVAWILSKLISRVTSALHKYALKVMSKRTDENSFNQHTFDIEKRTATLTGVARPIAQRAMMDVRVDHDSARARLDITPLIAGAGVAGIALSLGAQNFIKDIIGGVFLLLDNQIRVGDAVAINDTGGVVEEINLRTTLVRGENGALHIFSNGGINKLTNNSREFSFAVFEFSIDPRQAPDPAIAAIRDTAETLAKEEAYASGVIAPVEVYGVDRMTDSALIIKGRLKTLPGKQWAIGRELNRRIRLRFEADGILRPRPVTDVQFTDLPYSRDELKKMVQEAVAERPAEPPSRREPQAQP
ncbi:MAG: mechanosensitive ion channel family protein [Nibricoccus sp.]